MQKTLAIFLALTLPAVCVGQEEPKTVQQVARDARDSIVVVTTTDRDGDESGLGTGFVIDATGLIATNLHVIGEARPIWVQLRSGTRYEVTEIHASDRTLDLAVLRIEPEEDLPPLSLATNRLEVGQETVAIGHPLGLKNSVVSGLVASEREFDGVETWQVAMPIEPGNSGGPLLDLQGNVHGVVASKSTAPNQSFGFAVQVAQLKKLIDRPNPISIEQWKTIGRLDPNRWQALMGARWRQRGGRIMVEEPGQGFGGRSLLLRTDQQPDVPFEVAVSVKLEDESGAAGLVFHSDRQDRHYGFYPSGGRLRLTSFEGPSVFSWNVIKELESEHYRRGDWNEIKVRVEENKIIGYVNGHEIVGVDRVRQAPGSIGLCKFRTTKASFKDFRFGPIVPTRSISPALAAKLTEELSILGDRSTLLDIDLAAQGRDVPQRMAVLEKQARELENRAAELRRLSQDIHVAAVCDQLREVTKVEQDTDIDLLQGALLIAKLDNPELDVAAYVDAVDAMAGTVQGQFKQDMTGQQKLEKMDDFLFRQSGFHGSRTDYYNAANSHLDRVIDDREGLPITLSILYMALSERLGLNVVGVGLPGHFVVRHEPQGAAQQLIDVFDGGRRMSKAEAISMIFRMTRRPPEDDDFTSASNRDILARMLSNLLNVAESKRDAEATLRYLNGLVAVSASEPDLFRLRGQRAVLRHQLGRKRAAVDDLDWILEREPAGLNLKQIRSLRELFAK